MSCLEITMSLRSLVSCGGVSLFNWLFILKRNIEKTYLNVEFAKTNLIKCNLNALSLLRVLYVCRTFVSGFDIGRFS